jgi:hypothetical protein
MQKALTGWRELARPLVVDYVDRLAADIGSPPSLERAQALVQRLPVSVRISGPQVNWHSHPQRPERHWRRRDSAVDGTTRPPSAPAERTTADGHRIEFGLHWGGPGGRPAAPGPAGPRWPRCWR